MSRASDRLTQQYKLEFLMIGTYISSRMSAEIDRKCMIDLVCVGFDHPVPQVSLA
jgi:hypothetical protein